MDNPTHIALSAEGKAATLSLLAESLPFDDVPFSAWIDEAGNAGRLDLYFSSREKAESAMTRLQPHVAGNLYGDDPIRLSIREIAHEDWAESWKIHFTPTRISEHLVVSPSWETYTAPAGVKVVVIDPGMTFGTGLHESTRGCLQLMDHATSSHAGGSVLDIGCGSGILSIAAAKLGYDPVVGIDNYPLAIETSTRNAAGNTVSCAFTLADIANYAPNRPYNLVVANLLANLISDQAESITRCLAPRGGLIVSGIMTDQYTRVQHTLERVGLIQREQIELGEWTTGFLIRPV